METNEQISNFVLVVGFELVRDDLGLLELVLQFTWEFVVPQTSPRTWVVFHEIGEASHRGVARIDERERVLRVRADRVDPLLTVDDVVERVAESRLRPS